MRHAATYAVAALVGAAIGGWLANVMGSAEAIREANARARALQSRVDGLVGEVAKLSADKVRAK